MDLSSERSVAHGGSAPAAEELHAESCRNARWYACRTRGRAEKQVESRLMGAGFDAYLPVVRRERQWADRKKLVEFPLFPGYVFARFELSQVHDILATPGVATLVRLNGNLTPIRDEELRSVRRMLEGASETGLVPTAVDYLEPGDEVAVIDGPFRGMRGTLREVRGASRVVVRLSAIRQAVAVELNRKLLRRITA